MTGYDLLVTGHVAGAIGWVGSGTFVQILGTKKVSAEKEKPEELQVFMSDLGWISPRWFIPVSLWTVLFGILVVLDGHWSLKNSPFIGIGLAMFIVSFLIGVLFLGPQSEKIAKLGESEGPSSATYQQKVKKLILVSRFELALLWLTVAVMVIKPGG